MSKSKKTTRPAIQIEARPHPRLPETHWQVIVTTRRGYSFVCVWAGDRPSDETIRAAWVETRRDFLPYYS